MRRDKPQAFRPLGLYAFPLPAFFDILYSNSEVAGVKGWDVLHALTVGGRAEGRAAGFLKSGFFFMQLKMTSKEAEVFLRPDGCLYHIGLKEGELHPRILTVGDRDRAIMIAAALLEDVKEYESSRSFLTFSGTFRGTPVSIVCIGMGVPNMDFLVREASYLFQGKGLAFVRLGTCGIFNPRYSIGTLFISDRLYYTYRNYAYYDGTPFVDDGTRQLARPYLIAGPVEGDKELTDKLQASVERQQLECCRGTGITAETFYSCQGRCFPGFGDENAHVVEDFLKLKVDSCEMESHQLFHLCRQRAIKGGATTRAASICLGVVSRVDPNCPSKLIRGAEDCTRKILIGAAQAALEALTSVSI